MRTDTQIIQATDSRMIEIRQRASTLRGTHEPLAEAGLQAMQAQIEMLIDHVRELRGDIKALTEIIAEQEK